MVWPLPKKESKEVSPQGLSLSLWNPTMPDSDAAPNPPHRKRSRRSVAQTTLPLRRGGGSPQQSLRRLDTQARHAKHGRVAPTPPTCTKMDSNHFKLV